MTSIRKSSAASPLPGATSVGGEAEYLVRYSSAVATNRGEETLQPTPTRNTLLPFKRGGFRSVIEALEYAAAHRLSAVMLVFSFLVLLVLYAWRPGVKKGA